MKTYSIEKRVDVEMDLDISDILDLVSDLNEKDMQSLCDHIRELDPKFEVLKDDLNVVRIPNLQARIEFETWNEEYKKRWNL